MSDKIIIEHEINENVFDRFKFEDLFLTLSGKDCIVSCKKDNYYTMIVKNPIDDNDDELNILFFDCLKEISDSSVIMRCNHVDCEDMDMDIIHVNRFEITLTKNTVIVIIDFDQNRYPSYMKRVISECFERMVKSIVY